MKAKDLVAKYSTQEWSEKLTSILMEMVDETCELIDRRGATTAPALAAIYREQNQKWKTCLRLLNDEKTDTLPLFRQALVTGIPNWQKLFDTVGI